MEQENSIRNKQDFQNGKIYIIRNTINDFTYIGSTCQSLSKRMAQHRRDALRTTKKNKMKIHTLMNELDIENFYIELIEYYPCNTRDELYKKEGECIRYYKSELNKIIQGRSRKERNDENRDQYLNRKKEHYEKNKEHYRQKAREYGEQNKVHKQIKNKERYELKKEEINNRKKDRYNKNKDEINQRRREMLQQRKENDENFRKELNEKNREWYAKNKEKQCQRRKELRQLKKIQEQPEQEPETEDIND